MADGGEPYLLERPVRPARLWFLSPGEPRDFKTFERLCAAAINEAAETLLTDPRAALLLNAIGQTGRERLTEALERRIVDLVTARLVKPGSRQPMRSAFVKFVCVPLPRKGRIEGTLIVKAWRHTLRTTFDPHIGK